MKTTKELIQELAGLAYENEKVELSQGYGAIRIMFNYQLADGLHLYDKRFNVDGDAPQKLQAAIERAKEL